jgi:SAM-dependent methyltransferase
MFELPYNHFSDKSDLYARARPRYPAALYAWLAGLCRGRERAWDAACGSGQAAVDLADHFAEVQAADASEQQIANVLSHPRVTYSVQPSEATCFADHTFDLVCTAQALHWFDYDQFWPEVKRVLKPGGIFAAWGYAWFSIQDEIDAIIECSLLEVIRPYWPAQNRLLWEGYQNIPFPFERLEAPAFEMLAHWDLDELFAYMSTWSATRRAMAARGDGFFRDAYQAVQAAWGNQQTKRRAVMDFYVIAGRVGG